METVTRALWADAWIVIVLKNKNAFQQRPKAVNVKTAFSLTMHLFAKILMSVNRPSVMIKLNVSTQLVVLFVETSSQVLLEQIQD